MMLAGVESSTLLWILLVAALALTYWEARELNLDRRLTIWWLLLVFLTHVVGYLAMRIWAARRKKAVS
ncbi:MAG: hypothetical protein ACR2PK_04145 [Acidimicrobiales bacterium]